MKKILSYLSVFGLGVVFVLFFWRLYNLNEKPKPYEINFSHFSGKIAAESEVVIPEKNASEIPFEEAINWGPEAILIFGNQDGNFHFKIWRENQSAKGGSQYAKKEYDKNGPWGNVLWKIAEVKQQGNKFIFFPQRDKGRILPLLVVFGIIIVFFHSSWKSARGDQPTTERKN